MKKIRIIAFATVLVILTSSFAVHKFYVGVFQIEYKSEKKEFQITSRIFIDDLEKALESKHKVKLYLATPKEHKDSEKFITAYFKEKLAMVVNKKSQELLFLTKEYENDILVCYHKTSFLGKIKTIELTNSILTDQFTEQQNLVHTNILSNKKSFLFTHTHTQEKFNL